MHDSTSVKSPMTTDQYLARITRNTRPMPIVGGPPMPTGEPRPVVGEDPALLARAKKYFKPGETTVLEVIARTGISPQSLREWSSGQIEAFILRAEANNERDGVAAPRN